MNPFRLGNTVIGFYIEQINLYCFQISLFFFSMNVQLVFFDPENSVTTSRQKLKWKNANASSQIHIYFLKNV